RERSLLELGKVALGRVLDQQALVAAVVRLAHRGLHADLGRDAGQEQMRDSLRSQHLVQRRRIESTLAGLDDDGLAGPRSELRHDVVTRLAVDQNPTHRARVPDPERGPAALPLGRRAIGEIRTVTLARVDDLEPGTPRP